MKGQRVQGEIIQRVIAPNLVAADPAILMMGYIERKNQIIYNNI